MTCPASHPATSPTMMEYSIVGYYSRPLTKVPQSVFHWLVAQTFRSATRAGLKPCAMYIPKAALALGLCFHDAERRLRRHDPREVETGAVEQRAELLLRALASTWHDQHLEVEDLPHARLVARRNHRLDQDDAAVLRQHLPDVRQDQRRLVVVPVMNDVLHDVGVAAGRDGLEEVAGPGGDAAGKTLRLDLRLRARDHVLEVEQDPLHARMLLEDCREDGAVTAGDVDERADAAEVVALDDRRNHDVAEPGHRVVEHL